MTAVRTPVHFVPDKGRRLSPEEIAAVAPTITNIKDIKPKCCTRISDNCRYRAKRR